MARAFRQGPPLTLVRPPWNNLSFRRNYVFPLVSFVHVLFLIVLLQLGLFYGVVECCVASLFGFIWCFVVCTLQFNVCFRCAFDDMFFFVSFSLACFLVCLLFCVCLFAYLIVCLLVCLLVGLFVCCFRLAWVIDWLLVGWLVGWLAGWFHFVLFFGFIWFGVLRTCLVSHERCDPCELLLALCGFIELVSVMIRFRSSISIQTR